MKKTIYVILVLIVLGAVAYYVMGNKYANTNSPSNSQTTTSNTPVQNNVTAPDSTGTVVVNMTVDIKNFAFNPLTAQIKKGGSVVWINNDSVAHTITFNSSSMPSSSVLSPGQSFTTTFATTGTFSYHCSIHPMMQGSVVVTN